MSLEFNFVGKVSASKSIFNRLLIIKSFYQDFEILGDSKADDVNLMLKAVAQIKEGDNKIFECGHAGTVLRFLALRLSRKEGEFTLKGSKRLFSRPQKELLKILNQLGCDVKI